MNIPLAVEFEPSYAKPGIGFILLAVAATVLYWLYLRWRIARRRRDDKPPPDDI